MWRLICGKEKGPYLAETSTLVFCKLFFLSVEWCLRLKCRSPEAMGMMFVGAHSNIWLLSEKRDDHEAWCRSVGSWRPIKTQRWLCFLRLTELWPGLAPTRDCSVCIWQIYYQKRPMHPFSMGLGWEVRSFYLFWGILKSFWRDLSFLRPVTVKVTYSLSWKTLQVNEVSCLLWKFGILKLDMLYHEYSYLLKSK